MPRASRLALVAERLATSGIEPGSPMAEALAEARTAQPPPQLPPDLIPDAAPQALLQSLQLRHAEELAARDQVIAEKQLEGERLAEAARQILDRAVTAETAQHQAEAVAAKAQAQAQQTAGMVTALSLKFLRELGAHLNALVAYLLARVPLLGVLGGSFLLWRQVLADPTVNQLIGLGGFGLLVVAPVIWLSARVR